MTAGRTPAGDRRPSAPPRSPNGPVGAAPAARSAGACRSAKDWLDRPMTSLHLILAVFGLLLGFGLLMVLSSSSVAAFRSAESSFAVFTNQAVFAAARACRVLLRHADAVAADPRRCPPPRSSSRWCCWSPCWCRGSVATTTARGAGSGSATRLQFQPSEVAKLALLLWAAHVLAARRSTLRSLQALLIPVLPVFLLMVGLVMLQPDLGTTVTLTIVFLAVLYFAGAPLWIFGMVVALGAARRGVSGDLRRLPATPGIAAWLHPDSVPRNRRYQLYQSLYGMGNGGIVRRRTRQLEDEVELAAQRRLGLHLRDHRRGTGADRRRDGAHAVRPARLHRDAHRPAQRRPVRQDRRDRPATVWLVGQAIINIGYVVGLLPVTGIPLPMISAGGTSLVITMVVFGLLANFARREPQAAAALRGLGPRGLAAFLGVGVPVAAPQSAADHQAQGEAGGQAQRCRGRATGGADRAER